MPTGLTDFLHKLLPSSRKTPTTAPEAAQVVVDLWGGGDKNLISFKKTKERVRRDWPGLGASLDELEKQMKEHNAK